ncbi:serine carboxypeptidase II-3 [Iris pallida]|uniref:Serine carboxypeptidase II-3 n=1 Tax=Iris pallida TaxID=29817 RepID=A0AAX6DJE4_IRIPA|nr:serine carboxypeptidase II-3 [Iris pallida]
MRLLLMICFRGKGWQVVYIGEVTRKLTDTSNEIMCLEIGIYRTNSQV